MWLSFRHEVYLITNPIGLRTSLSISKIGEIVNSANCFPTICSHKQNAWDGQGDFCLFLQSLFCILNLRLFSVFRFKLLFLSPCNVFIFSVVILIVIEMLFCISLWYGMILLWTFFPDFKLAKKYAGCSDSTSLHRAYSE